MRGMNNQHRRTNFTPSDDALIRQQPITGMSLQILQTFLRTNREALMRRANELGVSLLISDESEGLSTPEHSAAPADSSTRH